MVKLEKHQQRAVKETVYLLHIQGCAYITGEMRTGKTLTSIFAAFEFLNSKARVLFLTTKKAMQSVMDDVSKTPYADHITVINYESLHKVDFVPDLLILDEAHVLGSFPKPARAVKILRDCFAGIPSIFLSGTPTPETYVQAFHQFYAVSLGPWKRFTNFYHWARHYVDIVSTPIAMGRTKNDYTKAKQQVIGDFKRYQVTMTTKEAGFESVIEDVVHTLPTPQRIKDLLHELRTRAYLVDYDVEAGTMSKMSQLFHQICSGTLIPGEDQPGIVLSSYKADYIKDKFAGKKIAVYYMFVAEFELLKKTFPKWTSDPEEFNASTNLVFLSQHRAGAFGVNLRTADDLVNFNMPFSSVLYQQVRARTHYKGRKETKVHYICSDVGFEQSIYDIVVKQKLRFTTDHFNNYAGTIYTKTQRSAIKENLRKGAKRNPDTDQNSEGPGKNGLDGGQASRNAPATVSRPHGFKARYRGIPGSKAPGTNANTAARKKK